MPTSTVLMVPSKSRNTDVRERSKSGRAITPKLAVIRAAADGE